MKDSTALSVKGFAEQRAADLTRYQNASYAKRYSALVERVHSAEADIGGTGLGEMVEKAYFKLLAYKDEYEVARLYTDGSFQKALEKEFQGPIRLSLHLAPPLIAKRDPVTGVLRKQTFGHWVLWAFKVLAKLKILRGTPLDIFGYTVERKIERRQIEDYQAVIDLLLANLNSNNHSLAVEIAGLPMRIRGFGHVKEQARQDTQEYESRLLADFNNVGQYKVSAAE
jgi:indolepyruvate ferredoxin oxidoreductase